MELDIIRSFDSENRPTEHQEFTDYRDRRVCDFSKGLDEEQAHHRNQDSAAEAGDCKTALQTSDFYVRHLWHSYLTIKTLTKLDEASFNTDSVKPGLLNFPSETVHVTI